MSKLEGLIKKLSPNGVPFKQLWEVTAWDKKFNAVDRRKQARVVDYHYFLAGDLKNIVKEDGDVKILTTNISNLYTKEEYVKGFISEGEIVCLPWGGNPVIQYFKGKFVTADNRIATSLNTDILLNKFLYYVLINKLDLIASFYRGSGIKHPDMSKVLDIIIPVPPIEVQREIVRILDNFTELTAELEAELEARTKQYEYYRNKLLDFSTGSVGVPRIDKMLAEMCPNGVALKTLGETCKIERGKVFSKQYIRENPGTYPLYSSQTLNDGLLGLIDSYNYDGEYLNWTTDGANAGTIFHRKGKFSITNVSGLIKPKEENINIRYLYYILSITAKSYVSYGMGNPKLMSNVMSTVVYPLPPLEIQNEIVKILDNFSEYITSISQGLPAEIAARRKQYEYYRNKLLTFDKE